MSRENNRDRAIDQLLRQSAGDPSVTADVHACVDGETLAAWTAGTLRSVESAAVEQHVADCERCQAMLATLVRATPVAPVAESWWRRHVRWLVPIATAATVAAIWVALPTDDARHPTMVVEVPETQSKAPAEPPPARSAALLAEEGSSARESAVAKDDKARAKDEDRQAATVARQANRADHKQAQKPARAESNEAARPGAIAAPPERPVSALPAPPAAPSLADAPALAKERDVLMGAAQARVVEIVSPDPVHRWRIIGGREVQHSTTSGADWQVVPLPSPDAMLTAGHSPAPSIVWVVGRGGVIFVATDPSHVVRVPFTEVVDFVSVRAIDDRQATVTAADGRAFRTTDGGATWSRVNP